MKTFNVKGMHCRSCEILITEALQEAGGTRVTCDFKKGTVQISGNLTDSKIKNIIKKEGYAVI